jgi:Clr5 domain
MVSMVDDTSLFFSLIFPYLDFRYKMAPQPLDLEPFREEIQILITEGLTLEHIARIIRDTHDHGCSHRTLKRRVKAWGVTQRKRPDNAPEIEAFVDARFHYSFDNDKDIVKKLQRDNYDITEYHVRALRWKNGWLRRAPNKSALRLQQAECLQRVKQALEEGSVRQYGAEMLTSFFRGQGVHLNL